jgi:modulator of FtsH protease HflC
MPRNIIGLFIFGFAAFIVLTSSLFTVSETEQAIVLRLGKEDRVINSAKDPSPGLHFKMPFFEDVTRFDKRAIALDMPEQEVLAIDKQPLVVDAFARFRIVNPILTYRTVRSIDGARDQLASILASRLRDGLGQEKFAALLSPERGELMKRINESLKTEAAKYGAEIIDVRIKRADLPLGDPLDAALNRMKTERQQEAQGIRSQGEREAQEIRAKADVEAAKIFADSFGRDAQFYDFYRTMQAYGRTLKKEDTTVVLSPDGAFMKPFQEGR